MFKMYFLNLVKINSEITLSYILRGKERPSRLNKNSVILYHQLFGIPKKGGELYGNMCGMR
jgi:hypothetical protein